MGRNEYEFEGAARLSGEQQLMITPNKAITGLPSASLETSRVTKYMFPIILAIAGLLRLPGYNESLWFDELWSTYIRLENILRLGNVAIFDNHPPFYSVFMYGWIRLFGDGEIIIRLPSLILGLLSIVLVYRLAIRFAGQQTALLTSYLMSVSPVHIWYSQEARPYSTTLFLLLLSIFSFYKVRESKSRRFWLGVYAISATLAIFSHYYVAVFIGLFTLLWYRKDRNYKQPVVLINASILILLASYLGVKAAVGSVVTEQFHLRTFTPREFWRLLFDWFLHGNSLRNSVLIIVAQIIFFAFFARGLLRFLRERRKQHYGLDVFAYLFTLPLLLITLWLIGLDRYYIERSLLVLLPFFYIVVAVGVVRGHSQTLLKLSGTLVVLISVVILGAFYVRGAEWTVYKPNPDWRSAASHLSSRANPAIEQPIFAITPATVLTYYNPSIFEEQGLENRIQSKLEKIQNLLGRDSSISMFLSRELDRYQSLIETRRDEALFSIHYVPSNGVEAVSTTVSEKGGQVFFMVHNRYWSGNFDQLMDALESSENYVLRETRSWRGLTIYEYEMNCPSGCRSLR